jgi:hypothetical protein
MIKIWMPIHEIKLRDKLAKEEEDAIYREIWKNEKLYEAQQILEEIKEHRKEEE